MDFMCHSEAESAVVYGRLPGGTRRDGWEVGAPLDHFQAWVECSIEMDRSLGRAILDVFSHQQAKSLLLEAGGL